MRGLATTLFSAHAALRAGATVGLMVGGRADHALRTGTGAGSILGADGSVSPSSSAHDLGSAGACGAGSGAAPDY